MNGMNASRPVVPETVSGLQFRYMEQYAMQVLFQNMIDIHVEEAESPCEMNRILKNALGGIFFHLGLFIPLTVDFDKWWFENRAEMIKDFKFFKQQLQVMQAMDLATRLRKMSGSILSCFSAGQAPEMRELQSRRWLLKDPQLVFIDLLCKTFPGAIIVCTHRNLKVRPDVRAFRLVYTSARALTVQG